MLPASIPETVARLEAEVRHTQTSSNMLHSLAESSIPTETAFALDQEPDDGEIEDLSCISSQTGLGESCDEVSDGKRDRAEEAYHQYKRARKKFRKVTPTRYRGGLGKGKSGKGFKPRKGKGTGQKGVEVSIKLSSKQKARTRAVRRGNPFGRDGKNMLCTLCSSPDHFMKECHEHLDNKGKKELRWQKEMMKKTGRMTGQH